MIPPDPCAGFGGREGTGGRGRGFLSSLGAKAADFAAGLADSEIRRFSRPWTLPTEQPGQLSSRLYPPFIQGVRGG